MHIESSYVVFHTLVNESLPSVLEEEQSFLHLFSNSEEQKTYHNLVQRLKKTSQAEQTVVGFPSSHWKTSLQTGGFVLYYLKWKLVVDQTKQTYQFFELKEPWSRPAKESVIQKEHKIVSYAPFLYEKDEPHKLVYFSRNISFVEQIRYFPKPPGRLSSCLFLPVFAFLFYQHMLSYAPQKHPLNESKIEEKFGELSFEEQHDFMHEKKEEIERRLSLWVQQSTRTPPTNPKSKQYKLQLKQQQEEWQQQLSFLMKETSDFSPGKEYEQFFQTSTFSEQHMILYFELILEYCIYHQLHFSVLSHALFLQRASFPSLVESVLQAFSIEKEEEKPLLQFLQQKMMTETPLFITLSQYQHRPFFSEVMVTPKEAGMIKISTYYMQHNIFDLFQSTAFQVPISTSWNVLALLIEKHAKMKWTELLQELAEQLFVIALAFQHLQLVKLPFEERISNPLVGVVCFTLTCQALRSEGVHSVLSEAQPCFSPRDLERSCNMLLVYIQKLLTLFEKGVDAQTPYFRLFYYLRSRPHQLSLLQKVSKLKEVKLRLSSSS